MIVTNTTTGEDITAVFLQMMKGEITSERFEEVTGLKREQPQAPIDPARGATRGLERTKQTE